MIVIGDKQSSNTKRLAQICAKYCRQVSLIDSTDQLQKADFKGVHAVSITAGASTPAWIIIKEVNKTMSEITTVDTAMEESFAELLEQSIKTLNTGDKVTGIVNGIGATESADRPGYEACRLYSV